MPISNGIDLDSPYPLSAEQVRHFREKGFVKLKDVLSPATITRYGETITAEVLRLNRQTKPMAERNTYQRAFLQVMNLWRQSEVVREFAFSRRLGRIAAELMGVGGVRMYHDQALYKEPGGGFTPWHADQYYWPLSNANSCTAWVPLQATPLEMGPLAFSVGSHRFESGRDMEISDESEQKISAVLEAKKLPMDQGPFELGEVSFHYGWTFHRAGPNTTDRPRAVMTVIYVEDGIRLAEPVNKNQIGDINAWMKGTKVGEGVATKLNPVIYRASPAGPTS
jgi:ectoine hydroxylase-related dioxygenase (phytanoyl-CoA dioxygenase family)